MNELQVFTNPEFGQVRTLTIEEEPWFVGNVIALLQQIPQNHGDGKQQHGLGDRASC